MSSGTAVPEGPAMFIIVNAWISDLNIISLATRKKLIGILFLRTFIQRVLITREALSAYGCNYPGIHRKRSSCDLSWHLPRRRPGVQDGCLADFPRESTRDARERPRPQKLALIVTQLCGHDLDLRAHAILLSRMIHNENRATIPQVQAASHFHWLAYATGKKSEGYIRKRIFTYPNI